MWMFRLLFYILFGECSGKRGDSKRGGIEYKVSMKAAAYVEKGWNRRKK